MPIGENVILVFQTFFMDTIIPSFNISGTSVVIEAATKRGIESGRATGAALLRQVSISAAFVIIMIIGFAILLVMGKLETGWLILGIGAVVAVGAIVAAMALAALHPQFLLKIIAPIEHAIDKVLARLHRHDIDTSVKKLVDTYSSSAKDMVHNVPSIVMELAWAVVANICEIICFAFVGLAFGMDDFTAVICIYVVVTLAAMASPIPQGVGVVEAAALVDRTGRHHGLPAHLLLASLHPGCHPHAKMRQLLRDVVSFDNEITSLSNCLILRHVVRAMPAMPRRLPASHR